MSVFILILLNCTWGIVQNIIGGIIFLANLCVCKNVGDCKNKHMPGERADEKNGKRMGKSFFYKGTCVSTWKKRAGLSMGLFIFVPIVQENVDVPRQNGMQSGSDAQKAFALNERLLKHEYGHSIQSAILGPLYIPIVGIPSILWCNVKPIGRKWRSGKMSYYDAFQEKWADKLGNV